MFNRYGVRALGALGAMGSIALALPLFPQQVQAAQAGPDFVYTITPCRIFDSRSAGGIFAGILQPNETRSIRTWNEGGSIPNQGGSPSGCPDVPQDATGVFINVQAAAPQGTSANWFGVAPYGIANPSTAINYSPTSGSIGNSQIVSTCWGQWISGAFTGSPFPCTNFDLTFNNGPNASAHLVVDITGFTRDY